MFGNGPRRRRGRPPLAFMVLVGEMCVFGGLADLLAEVLGHTVSAEGTAAGASLIVLGAAWLFWGWSRGR
jgi:succinate-acetate transporter protein